MNKKISLGMAIALMALVAAATFIITYNYSMGVFNSKVKSVSEKEGTYTKLAELDKFIRSSFIGDINEEALMNNIMRGYVSGLGDKYAQYYTPDEYSTITQKESGVVVGFGFDFEKEESGYIKVTAIAENTSAFEHELEVGDIITAVNNTDVIAYENGYDEAVSFFKCDEGTKIKLHVKRKDPDGVSEFLTFDLVASKRDIISVYYHVIDENIGYIKITTFNDKTPEQFKEALNTLISGGAESIILDVRNNAGGLIESLQGVVDTIIGDADVVKAYYKDSEEVVVKTTEAEKIKMPMVVLVNGNTASCSELMAFALRDLSGAQVVGTSSYGKGVMQTTHKLSGGAAVKITVATLQTDKSGDYNGVGIKPDFEVSIPAEIDINALTDEEQLLYDSQLIKAVEVITTIK